MSIYQKVKRQIFQRFCLNTQVSKSLQQIVTIKKLRPGDLVGNEFVVTLSEVTDIADVEQRLEKVKQVGVPNYFGSQRFGNDGNNLEEARRWGRENVRTRNQNKRSMYLSAARSWIFNRIVSARLENGVFDKFIDGDIAQTNSGTQLIDANNITDLQVQFAQGEVAITAALAGDNALLLKPRLWH